MPALIIFSIFQEATKLQNVDAISMASMLAVEEANVFQGNFLFIWQCFEFQLPTLFQICLIQEFYFISRLNVCDGSFDCLDGTDEFICPTNSKYMIQLWKNQTAEAEEAESDSEAETTTVLSSLKVNSLFSISRYRQIPGNRK